MIFCYHNGALGHATMALLECCTKEGNQKLPSFAAGQNLHHFVSSGKLFKVHHPHCDIDNLQRQGRKVVCATSGRDFGRFLILLMGLQKCIGAVPGLNSAVVYKQFGQEFGDQLEILSLTLRDKVYKDDDWFMNADHKLDITDYWTDLDSVISWIEACELTPDRPLVEEWCKLVSGNNQGYWNDIQMCLDVVNMVKNNIKTEIELDFWQIAVCHAKLMHDLGQDHQHVRLLTQHPTTTSDIRDCFYE